MVTRAASRRKMGGHARQPGAGRLPISPGVCDSRAMRTGSQYVASLKDGRAIFLDGERVADVTAHPAFAESVRRVAERYDAAGQAPEVTTCVDPASGRRIGAMWL